MELGELDLDAVEAECGKNGKGYVPKRKIELLQEAIIKVGAHPNLGGSSEPWDRPRSPKRKQEEVSKGGTTQRKENKQAMHCRGRS